MIDVASIYSLDSYAHPGVTTNKELRVNKMSIRKMLEDKWVDFI